MKVYIDTNQRTFRKFQRNTGRFRLYVWGYIRMKENGTIFSDIWREGKTGKLK